MSDSYKIKTNEKILEEMKLFKENIGYKEGFAIMNLKESGLVAPYKSPRFRPDNFAFLFVKKGYGTTFMNNSVQTIKPLTIRFANMYVLRELVLENLDEIYVIVFEESFLKTYVRKDFYKTFPFLVLESSMPRESEADFFSDMEKIYMEIYDEYKKENRNYFILGHFLGILLHKFSDEYWSDKAETINAGNVLSETSIVFKNQLTENFIELINGKSQKVLKLKDYAYNQNLHPKHFNTIIKIKTGKTVSDWIFEKIIEEAKILLKESQMTIKEISDLFGYSEPTHFSYFFKKKTNILPSKYRNK